MTIPKSKLGFLLVAVYVIPATIAGSIIGWIIGIILKNYRLIKTKNRI